MMIPATYKKAFAALQAIGAPVTLKEGWFVLSAEENDSTVWADDDYDGQYVNPAVEAILSKHGLDYCWHDAGTVFIHRA
jgi:hypothetical protein